MASLPSEAWIDSTQFLRAVTEGLIKTGGYIEVVTLNNLNTLDGTALFKIEGMYAPSSGDVV